ncbi:MAG: trypsin-like peptidase domain-containing protein [Bellilinea sp.]|jgi:serine protease Do
MKQLRILIGIVGILSLVTACNPSTPGEPSPVATSAELQPTPPPVEQPTATQPVDVLGLLRNATVQIEAQGSFIDPELGSLYNVAGRGTGFIIDPSGIAVTNNHVVTGAALLKVYLAGEDRPRNAKILGVSECWDLAVIDIEGDDLPFLPFSDQELTPGVEVYAAGFPLGDPEYTLTKGIVSKANADGESFWASVPAVIEHDARIRGGNSGGPLVNMAGQVVGVNYAGNDRFDQNFAIRARDAQKVIEVLRSGQDFESIGINGQAVVSEDQTISGIWVSSVKSGSPAGKAGVQGGDIITRMEGLILATDGQMTDYCNILRTRNATDTIAIEVLRFSSQEYLDGELNGKALETSFSFAQQLEEDVTEDVGGQGYGDYVLVQDDYGAIQVAVPSAWAQVDGSPWVSDGEVIGASITAAADVERFNNYFDEPGVFFGVSNEVAKLAGYIQLLDYYQSIFQESCSLEGRSDYEDSAFEGAYDVYKNCDQSGNLFVVLTARPIQDKTALLVTVLFNAMTDTDLEAFDQVLATFDVVGSLP